MPRTIVYLVLALLLAPASYAEELRGPHVEVTGDEVMVSAEVVLNEKQISEIEKGVSKEIVVYFDLFRRWAMWPDEFIAGRKFTQTLHCDPVKKEYIVTSLVGRRLTEKRFSNCDNLVRWSLGFTSVSLASTRALEPADYMVKVTVESRLRRLPPFINLLFFFVKEKEFEITSDSRYFPVKPER